MSKVFLFAVYSVLTYVSPMHDWYVMTCIMLSVRNDLNSSAKFKLFFILGETFLLFVLFLSLNPLKQ